MRPGTDAWFVLLGAAVVAAAAATAVASPGPAAGPDARVSFEAGVPDEYDFEQPTADGTAVVDGREFGTVAAALAAADPGDTVTLSGRFEERVAVTTPGVTLTSAPGATAVVDGGGEGDVLVVDAPDVTVRRVWVRNSGYAASDNDAGVWLNGTNATVVDSRVTAVTFGVWIDGVDGVRVANTTIVGRESVRPLSRRGNGVQIWKTEDSVVEGNRITDVRDGIYYSWASGVTARGNTMWDLRYGVHYMYSDDCRLAGNTAFDNDVGYALMVSKRLEIVNNTAVNNTGESGHGLLVKSVDETLVRGNDLVENGKGLYVYNSLDNTVTRNLVVGNDVGVHLAAGSVREEIHHNSFVHNDRPVLAVTSQQVAWNTSGPGDASDGGAASGRAGAGVVGDATGRGNYWTGARAVDRDGDGVSEIRYRPSGLVEHLVRQHPTAAVFANSPAFDAIRLAESALSVVEAPGVVDHYPLVEPPREGWRRYYGGPDRPADRDGTDRGEPGSDRRVGERDAPTDRTTGGTRP